MNVLIEFPADDPERALRFWSGLLDVELEPREEAEGSGWQSRSHGCADRSPRARARARRHGLAALLRRGRHGEGARARGGAGRQHHPSRREVGDLQGLGGKPLRAGGLLIRSRG